MNSNPQKQRCEYDAPMRRVVERVFRKDLDNFGYSYQMFTGAPQVLKTGTPCLELSRSGCRKDRLGARCC